MVRKPFITGVCGGSGSGKTSFIQELRKNFTEDELCLLSQDNYYHSIDQQAIDDAGVVNFDLPGSIDSNLLRSHIQQLSAGQEVLIDEYTFNNEKSTSRQLTFRPAPLMVIEGIFVFHEDALRNLMDLKIFIHAKDHLRIIRRIKRDQAERNYPIDDVLYRFEHHVRPAYEEYIEPYAEYADLVVMNNQSFRTGLMVVEGFLRKVLQEPNGNGYGIAGE